MVFRFHFGFGIMHTSTELVFASPADFGYGVWLPLGRELLIISILHHLVLHGKIVFSHSFAIGYSPLDL